MLFVGNLDTSTPFGKAVIVVHNLSLKHYRLTCPVNVSYIIALNYLILCHLYSLYYLRDLFPTLYFVDNCMIYSVRQSDVSYFLT